MCYDTDHWITNAKSLLTFLFANILQIFCILEIWFIIF